VVMYTEKKAVRCIRQLYYFVVFSIHLTVKLQCPIPIAADSVHKLADICAGIVALYAW
jgi:hypothetical protein